MSVESAREGAGAALAGQGLWSIGQAVSGWLAPGLSTAFVSGMTGGVIRASGDTPTFTDLQSLVIPGLASLGIHAELLPFPQENQRLQRLLRERLLRGVPVPVLAFESPDSLSESPISTENTEDTDKPSLPSFPPLQATEISAERRKEEGDESVSSGIQTASGQGLIVQIGAEGGTIIRQEADGAETQTALEGLHAVFTHLLRIRKEERRGRRWAGIQAALMRWLAFAEAYPQRLPGADESDAHRLAEAAAFLLEAAGRKRDPVAIRLRRAAARFAEARSPAGVQEAIHRLREALL
ncbi:MAG TPA: hypothetical protein VKT32_11145, partial [Chthonomonadaceae bacterium]|nr:hypothetical protein [Chthonomonadaceae bacterium]